MYIHIFYLFFLSYYNYGVIISSNAQQFVAHPRHQYFQCKVFSGRELNPFDGWRISDEFSNIN